MTKEEYEELAERLDDTEKKLDELKIMLKAYLEEVNWFIAESAGAMATLKNLYVKKSRS